MSLSAEKIKPQSSSNGTAKTEISLNGLDQEIINLGLVLDDITIDQVAGLIKFHQGEYRKKFFTRIGDGNRNHRQTLVAMVELLTPYFPGQKDLTDTWLKAAYENPVENQAIGQAITIDLQDQLSLVMEINGPKTTLSLVRPEEET